MAAVIADSTALFRYEGKPIAEYTLIHRLPVWATAARRLSDLRAQLAIVKARPADQNGESARVIPDLRRHLP